MTTKKNDVNHVSDLSVVPQLFPHHTAFEFRDVAFFQAVSKDV